jgi:hypothetical protein
MPDLFQIDFAGFPAGALFDKEAFDRLVDVHGRDLWWEKSMFCPCIDLESKAPDFNCALCNGQGFLYFDRKCIKGIVTALSASKVFREGHIMGDWVIGKSALTVIASDLVSFRDRITHDQSIITYVAKELFVDAQLAYPQRYPVVDVLAWRSESEVYKLGEDFTVVDGVPTFTATATLPKHDEPLSILYTYHPVWIVLDHIHVVRDVSELDTSSSADEVTMVRAPRHMLMELEYFNGAGPTQVGGTA